MPSFILAKTPMNKRIIDFVTKSEEGLRVKEQTNKIRIEVPDGFELNRLYLESAISDFRENDWNQLFKEVAKTATGCKIHPPRYQFNPKKHWVVRFFWLRNKQVLLRLNSLEDDMIRKAAKLSKRNVSDFIRVATMRAVNEEFDKETVRRQREHQQQQATVEAKPQPYVG